MKCKHCGAEIANDSVYCESCGMKVHSWSAKKKLISIVLLLFAVSVVGIIFATHTSKKNDASQLDNLNTKVDIYAITGNIKVVGNDSKDNTDIGDMDFEHAKEIRLKERNCIMVNCSSDRVQVNGEMVNLEDLKSKTKEILGNPTNRDDYPEKKAKSINGFSGTEWYDFNVSQGVVNLVCDERSLNGELYNKVKETLVQAINEMRDELSVEIWHTQFYKLEDSYKREAICEAIPLIILEKKVDSSKNSKGIVDDEKKQSTNLKYNQNDEVYIIPDEEPEFIGGEERLYEYISENLRYPDLARDSGITGKVYVQFTVERDGTVSNVNLKRDIGYGCGDEAVRVVRGTSGMWRSGKVGGRPVRSQFVIPINFVLR